MDAHSISASDSRRPPARPSASDADRIAAIAARYGFTNPAVFSRTFTSAYGTTPSRYRELRRF